MSALVTILVMLLLAGALGRRLFRMLRFPFDSPADEFAFSAALGFGVFSFVIMGIGLAGWLKHPSAWLVLLLASCLLVPDAARWVADLAARLRAPIRPALSAFEWFLALAVAAALACGFISSLAPPTSWDATTSHLPVPLTWLDHGVIDRLEDVHSNGPLNAVMLFIPALRFGGDTAPALLHFAFMGLAGLALFALASRRLSRAAALLAAAAFFLMPIAAVLGPEALVDFPLLLYVVLGFSAFIRWWEGERTDWLLLAAVCVGLAAGTKYTGLHAALLLCVGIAIRAVRARPDAATVLSRGAAAIVLAALIGCPWYVRNAALTGNPVYPILADVIPTRHLSAAWTGRARVAVAPRPYPTDLADQVLFPVNYTFGFARGLRGGPSLEGALHSPGPLFLAFIPLLLLIRPVPPWAKFAAGLALAGLVLLVPMFPLPRYVLPFVAPCVLAIGYGFDALTSRAGVRRAVCIAVVAVFLVQLAPFAGRAVTRLPVVVGRESRDAYLRGADDVYPMAFLVAHVLPPHSRVFYAGERLHHFQSLRAPVVLGMPLRQTFIDFPTLRSPGELLDHLRALGFTHLVADETLLRNRVPFALELIRALDGHGLVLLERIKGHALYCIAPAAP